LDAEPVGLLSAGASGCPVVLYSPQRSLLDTEGRVHLSRGTCRAEAIDQGSPHYLPEARVPVPDWRTPTEEDRSVLWSDAAPQAHRCVGVVRLLGPQLIRLFAARNDIFERVEDGETLKHPLVGLLLDIIRKAGLVAGNLHSARMGRDQPGLVTMTKAVDQDARIGLHFDQWDRLAVDEMERASNRVSINLGPEDRYFIFLNRTASDMAAVLDRANLRVGRHVSAIGSAFMSAFPEYPVVRLRLRPGEAYVAPTENILHDGSSADVRQTNHYLSVRGRFDFTHA
jgi:hypothetical protein